MSIRQVPIRATVSVGGTSVKTPYVLSFNVHRRRGVPATFDASLKVKGGVSGGGGSMGGGISISAGGGGGSSRIFTGMVRGGKVTPCWDDPSYVILTLTGDDALSLIKGKKYTRRCRGTKSTFCVITDVVRGGLKSGKFAYSTGESFEFDPGRLNSEIPSVSQASVSTLRDLVISDAEGSDLKNNLGVQVDVTIIASEEV